MRFVLAFALGLTATACVPHRDLSADQIEHLSKLDEVMDVQATVADPLFKKVGSLSYGDSDWAAFADLGTRIQATSRKIPQFSKGPEFDALAQRLHGRAEALSTAAAAKNAIAASDALAQMKATCKECHAKFK